jgi:hypothetical protein
MEDLVKQRMILHSFLEAWPRCAPGQKSYRQLRNGLDSGRADKPD